MNFILISSLNPWWYLGWMKRFTYMNKWRWFSSLTAHGCFPCSSNSSSIPFLLFLLFKSGVGAALLFLTYWFHINSENKEALLLCFIDPFSRSTMTQIIVTSWFSKVLYLHWHKLACLGSWASEVHKAWQLWNFLSKSLSLKSSIS